MISTISKDYRQPSFHRLDYSDYECEYDSESNMATHYAYTPQTATYLDKASRRAVQSCKMGKRRRIVESPSVKSISVRPFSRFDQYDRDYSIEEEAELDEVQGFDEERGFSPKPAIICETLPIGEPYRCNNLITNEISLLINKFIIFYIFRVRETRAHKQPAFSILNEKCGRRTGAVGEIDYNRLLRPRSASMSSLTSEPSRRRLSIDDVQDWKFGKISRTQSAILAGKKKVHDMTIIRNEKFRPEPNASIVGKSRRTYIGSLRTYWKRAGHDTRVMHNIKESSVSTEKVEPPKPDPIPEKTSKKTAQWTKFKAISAINMRGKKSGLSDIQAPNPTSLQKGLLKMVSKDENDEPYIPKPGEPARSKSAVKVPALSAAQKLAARRAKSNSPAARAKAKEEEGAQYLEGKTKKRLTEPFEVVETDLTDTVPELPASVKKANKKALETIAGTPTKSEQGGDEDTPVKKTDKSKGKQKLKAASTVQGRMKIAMADKKAEKEEGKTSKAQEPSSGGESETPVKKPPSSSKGKLKLKGATTLQGRLKLAVADKKEEDSAREKSASVETRGSTTTDKKSSAGKEKKKERTESGQKFVNKASAIKNISFLSRKKKPKKSSSESQDSDADKNRKDKSAKKDDKKSAQPKLKLQGSTSAGTLKSDDSVEEKQSKRERSARSGKKSIASSARLSSAMSGRLKSAQRKPPPSAKPGSRGGDGGNTLTVDQGEAYDQNDSVSEVSTGIAIGSESVGNESIPNSAGSSLITISKVKTTSTKKIESARQNLKQKRWEAELSELEEEKKETKKDKKDKKESKLKREKSKDSVDAQSIAR